MQNEEMASTPSGSLLSMYCTGRKGAIICLHVLNLGLLIPLIIGFNLMAGFHRYYIHPRTEISHFRLCVYPQNNLCILRFRMNGKGKTLALHSGNYSVCGNTLLDPSHLPFL